MQRPGNVSGSPVVIIGAGPVGLAAAAHLAERNLPFLVVEVAGRPGASIDAWRHVRLFSPWRYLIDNAAGRLLSETGWRPENLDILPTGGHFLTAYLEPLAAHPRIRPYVRYGARVKAITRQGIDKVKSNGRQQQPFELALETGERLFARVVLDVSGTWLQPNPVGSGGIAAIGEYEHAARIAYGIPDVLGSERGRYMGKRVLVVGSGHSAMNSLLDLLSLTNEGAETSVIWALRRSSPDNVYGGGSNDALSARGALGSHVRDAVSKGRLDVVAPFNICSIEDDGNELHVSGDGGGKARILAVDEIIASTGFRPDINMLRELRIELDPWLEAPIALAPMIDPNIHSCGTVRPHGAVELSHPEQDFYILGMKSYGRAPTFLMATGYEQARSVVAMLAGDSEAARRVELVLPETGVCGVPSNTATSMRSDLSHAPAAFGSNTPITQSGLNALSDREEMETMTIAISDDDGAGGCCGGSPPKGTDACCLADFDAKAEGEVGCGRGARKNNERVGIKARSQCCS